MMHSLNLKIPAFLMIVIFMGMFTLSGCSERSSTGGIAGLTGGQVPISVTGAVDTQAAPQGAPERLGAPAIGYRVRAVDAVTGQTIPGAQTTTDAAGNFVLDFMISVKEDKSIVIIAQDPNDTTGATILRTIIPLAASKLQTLINQGQTTITVGIISQSTEDSVRTVEAGLGLVPGTLGMSAVALTHTQINDEAEKDGFVLDGVTLTIIGGVDTGGGGPGPVSMELVSVNDAGQPADDLSDDAAIDHFGQFIAFDSYALNLAPFDTLGFGNIYLHDAVAQQTDLLSVALDGGPADGDSLFPSISADGQFVAFDSDAANLVADDPDIFIDVFVSNTVTKEIIRLSVDSAGIDGDDDSMFPSISADGAVVAFESYATNLVAGDTNLFEDVFAHDVLTATTRRVSVSGDGTEGDGDSYAAAVSGDGNFVAFASDAGNLVSNDTNGSTDIFFYSLETGLIERVNVGGAGSVEAEPGSVSSAPYISFDGRFVAFESDSLDIAAGGALWKDIFVHDRQTGATTRISMGPGGIASDGDSYFPSISDDGRYVAFESDATNLIAGGTNFFTQIYVHDRQTGLTKLVSRDATGVMGDGNSNLPRISRDGKKVAFSTDALNLLPDPASPTQVLVVDNN